MSIESLSILLAFVLAISLVTERVMTLLRTVIPAVDSELSEPGKERVRRMVMQVLAFLVAWCTAGFMVTGDTFDLFGQISLTGAGSYPVMMMGVLGTGGSAFWKDLLGITNTIKKIKKDKVPQ